MNYKVNQQKCVGCQVCLQTCPGSTKMNNNGKAEVVSNEKIEKCGGEDICPSGAIEKIDDEENNKEVKIENGSSVVFNSSQTRGLGRGQNYGRGRGQGSGQGRGAGRGRGFGGGPRDGRGMGRGGGRGN